MFNIDKKRDSRRRQSLAVLAAMEKMGEKKQQLNRLKVTYCRRTGVISSIHGAVRVDANFTSIEVSMFLNGKDFEWTIKKLLDSAFLWSRRVLSTSAYGEGNNTLDLHAHKLAIIKGAVSRNPAKLGNYKMPVKLRKI